MAFNPILSGEVDANSPVSSTLMGKIRQNENFLYGVFSRTPSWDHYNNLTKIIAGQTGWNDIFESYISILPCAKTLKVRIEVKDVGGETTAPQLRIHLSSGDNSEIADLSEIPQDQWSWFDLTLPASGALVASGDVTFTVQGQHNTAGGVNRIFQVRGLMIRVLEVE